MGVLVPCRRRRLGLVLLVCLMAAVGLAFLSNYMTVKKQHVTSFLKRSSRNRVTGHSTRESHHAKQTHAQRPVAWDTCVDLLQRNQSKADLTESSTALSHSHHLNVAAASCLDYTQNWQQNLSAGVDTRDFPIAYILVVHKNAAQVELLLHSIYTPYNVYCIHVDKRSPSEFRAVLSAVADCYDNVFISRRLESVVYGGYSRLQADLNCLHDLVSSPVRWRYVINLAGQDFPLKTQNEIVAQLRVFGGQNDIPGVQSSSNIHGDRTRFVHDVVSNSDGQMSVVQTEKRKSPPPHNVTIYTGIAYYIASRAFMSWVLTDKVAKDLLEWSQDTYSPDEFYWATLNKLPSAPGGFSKPTWSSSIRAIKWVYFEGKQYPPCQGKYVRDVCIFGVGDMQWLIDCHHLFANKFDLNFDPVILQCLQELLKWRGERPYDTRFTAKDFPRKDMPWLL
ncbi:N-acetyllactosaminide beta-1,6-N-acetylglucosaminyl-transferase-like [Branchiostoma floridae]|uniref:N-acetyllactosaminide beta-1,6-N-acetylglucosaminyl-transferase-like n=1 Tax=Branchiostoma floridae TaxID=7739 RepID=A0A9J7M1Y5_BRAFL|nr:N-acetyllactosaminide beta-1,6-N-acetylglucosaminyl-transferase-like [Branchiostoma floridae]